MYLMNSMTDDAEIKGFDPFAILGVTPSTGKQEIKKQYRALSLIYHPDKVSSRLEGGACNPLPLLYPVHGACMQETGRQNAVCSAAFSPPSFALVLPVSVTVRKILFVRCTF